MPMNDLPGLYLQSPQLNQLNLLREIAANPRITQAELARLCSLSVAMVNNYMKELSGSGYMEYHRKTIKSVTYHLTPEGRFHLESLQCKLIKEMVDMFAAAKEEIRARICSRSNSTLQRVILCGSGHLAQIAFHALEQTGINVIGVCDDTVEMLGRDFCGREVLNPSQIRFLAPDAVVVADSVRCEEICRNLEFVLDRGIELIRLDVPPKAKAQSGGVNRAIELGAKAGEMEPIPFLPSQG